ncbi:hypothetical protein AALC25_09820 [Lachnospiraceae bacterium 29-84]
MPEQTGGIAEGTVEESSRTAGEAQAAFKKTVTDNKQHKTFR